MQRFFLFAVLWTALFGPGHVLAACPMGQSEAPAAHAPCHTEANTGHETVPSQGHNCCAWLAPSTTSTGGVVQKSTLIPVDADLGSSFINSMLWDGPQASRPPPLPIPQLSPPSASLGTTTFLRTGRLRL